MSDSISKRYIRIYLTEELHEQVLRLRRVHKSTPGKLLRPFVVNGIVQLQSALPEDVALQHNLVLRAMKDKCATLTEIVEWTGLDRRIVQTTLSELLEDETIREHRGRGKIVNYFPKKRDG